MTKHRLFWPVVALLALLLGDLIASPAFFSIELRDGHLYGNLVDILKNGAPLILIAIGMTLVIATRGIDLSVGAVVAISGSLACLWIADHPDGVGATLVAVGLALGLSLVLGVWNGWLVAQLGIQPIIATLILMVAGRGIAQLISGGQIITINSAPYEWIGSGFVFTLPSAILIALALFVLASLLVRRSALGLLVEAVGGNPEASRLAGLRSARLTWLVYVFCALCAGIAGLMISANVHSADANNAGLFIELDAILAVVIGGTQLTGGRFSLAGSVLGALLIQTLTTTVYALGIPPKAIMLFKAVVVLAVCLLQSPAFRRKLRRRKARPAAPAPASAPEKVEVTA
ncbi:ABC transporter permease [Amycolatopsis sp. SID8362]|uniref:ABC transporter permease n=1 Tax=Amycolatopsis sp. SID8362 TaxID=2690346 RepID=UPI00136B5C75|nr:ABC transporter permease [Amycolatopsis sp. SID8362]NBH09321.1 ABC transporter permease [Amycolatopsis sp. SID8362]NED46014.1 ABC transporter permease [Amycolatopsis sp. SID8362]